MSADDLARLVDEAAVRDLVAAYALGLDLGDWDLWRSVFTDEVLIDLTDYEPEPPPQRLAVAVHEAYVRRLFAGFDATQHLLGTTRVVLAGDSAVVTAHMRAEHWLTSGQGGDRYTMYGTYIDECVRTDAGWRITSVKLTLLREEGNRHLMRLAARRGREGAP